MELRPTGSTPHLTPPKTTSAVPADAGPVDRVETGTKPSLLARAVDLAGRGALAIGAAGLKLGEGALYVGGAAVVGGMYLSHIIGHLGADQLASHLTSSDRGQAGARFGLRSLGAAGAAAAIAGTAAAILGGPVTILALLAGEGVGTLAALGSLAIERPDVATTNPALIEQTFPHA